jgi:hypothetical protein
MVLCCSAIVESSPRSLQGCINEPPSYVVGHTALPHWQMSNDCICMHPRTVWVGHDARLCGEEAYGENLELPSVELNTWLAPHIRRYYLSRYGVDT